MLFKFVDAPEGISTASLVWLDRIERVYRILPHALYFSLQSGFVFRGGIKDGESAVDARFIPAGDDELTYEVIQGTPEILDNIATDERYVSGNVSEAFEVVMQELRSLRIIQGADFVRLARFETGERSVKLTDVLFGPLDFKKGREV